MCRRQSTTSPIYERASPGAQIGGTFTESHSHTIRSGVAERWPVTLGEKHWGQEKPPALYENNWMQKIEKSWKTNAKSTSVPKTVAMCRCAFADVVNSPCVCCRQEPACYTGASEKKRERKNTQTRKKKHTQSAAAYKG